MFVLEGFRLRLLLFAWGLIFLLLIPLEDTRPGGAQAAYDHAMQTFQRGDLAKSQREAEMEIWQFQT